VSSAPPTTRKGSTNRRLRLVLTVFALGTAGSPARLGAQTQPTTDGRRVLIVTSVPGDPFLGKVRAEISSLGLEVVVRAPQGSIEASARAAHAVAAVRMLPSRKGIEVWMADATSGRSLLRQTIVDEEPGGPNQDVVALQTAELLRTSLFPHPPPKPPAAPLRPAPPVVVHVLAPPVPAAGENGVRAAFGLLHGAGGASAAWQAGLAYRYLWDRTLGVALTVSVPVLRGVVQGTEGSADVGAFAAGGELLAHFEPGGGRLRVTPGLGTALVAVWASGQPNPAASQLVSSSAIGYTALGYVCVALDAKVSSWFRLGASALGGATTSRVRVRFAGNDAGAWGTPVLGARLYGEVTWR